MAHDLSGESNSDMLDESENELNVTTYFNDSIESSSDDSNERKSLEDGGKKAFLEAVNIKAEPDGDHAEVSMDLVDSKQDLGDDLTEVPMELVECVPAILKSSEVFVKNDQFGLEDDLTEVPMDLIMSPTETKKNHLITCPVCFEISILCKNSTLYDNLIFACMEQRTK